MEIIKKYKWFVVVALVMLAAVFSLFYSLYHHDVNALTDFSVSYEKFDKSILDFSISQTDDLQNSARDAVIELTTIAHSKLSSLIKNDAELMNQALLVADLSARELVCLKSYKGAIQSKKVDIGELAIMYGELNSKRKIAYARFQELAGLKE